MQPVSDAAVRSYQIADHCSGSFAHPVLGEITWTFAPGTVQPKSEGEELVLEAQLVPCGLATVVDEAIPARIVSVGNPDEDQVAPDVDESAPLSVPTSGAKKRKTDDAPEGDA